jgi:hypothetical protein
MRFTLLLTVLALAGCAASDHVAPSPMLHTPGSPRKDVVVSQFPLGAILDQDLAPIYVGNVETIGFGTTQVGIVDCALGTFGYIDCSGTIARGLDQICNASACSDGGIGPCANVSDAYPFAGSSCYVTWFEPSRQSWPLGTHTFWARARTAATTEGRSQAFGTVGQPNGIFYIFDHWITTTPCVEGTQTGLTCTFTFSATGFATLPLIQQDWGSIPVYRATDYHFGGFLQPVSSTDRNIVKAGSGVPIKFSLGDAFGLNVLAAGSPTSTQVACLSSAPTSAIEEASTAGASGLSYDAASGIYTYAWKTDKAWTGTCRQFTLTLLDNETFSAVFQFTK